MAERITDPELSALRPTLLRFATLQLRDAAAAEDAVQETLLAALEGRASFAGRSGVQTWVVAILKNKIIDRLRRGTREISLAEAVGDADADFDDLFDETGHWREAPADWGDPAASFQQERFFEVLEVCMQALPENLARVFTMREVLGLETEEICKELRLSSSNFWVILHRARMRLRECLQLRWFGEGAKAS